MMTLNWRLVCAGQLALIMAAADLISEAERGAKGWEEICLADAAEGVLSTS